MPEGIQRYERTRMVLPLRVLTDEHAHDASGLQLAHTIDISPIGGRLGGLRTELSPGQTITLQRGQHKAAFRVIWSRRLSVHENQAGIEALDAGRNIWGIDLPQSARAEKSAPVPAANHASALQVASAPTVTVRRSRPMGRRLFISPMIPRKILWGLSCGLFILSGVLSISVYREILNDTSPLAIQIPVPAPPSAAELARMTPKPRVLPVVTEVISVPRMEVAEVPTGRIVYPVSPDGTLGGKVRLQVVIAANGLVKQIHVLSGSRVLAQAAEQAIRFWHYRPFHSEDGPPTERATSVVVCFRGSDAVSLEFPTATAQTQVN